MRRSPELDRLIAAAERAQKSARCAHSGFAVGAAVLGGSGQVHPGCNVESPTLIHGICAERAAIFAAIGRGEKELKAICTVAPTAYPCGVCRQAILEFLGPDAPIYAVLDDPRTGRRKVARTSARALMPHAYTEKDMREGRR